jgi:hypothetical protein
MQNKSLYTLFSLLMVVTLVGAGCLGGRSAEDQARDVGTAGDTSRVGEVEAKLGIELPADSEIFTVIDNQSAYITSVLTMLAVHDVQGFLTIELAAKGLRPTRPFGTLPTDNATNTSAVFSGDGETWAINVKVKGEKTEFSIQRQY